MLDLIGRAEQAEARAWRALVEQAPAGVRRAAGLAVEAIGSGCVMSATGLDSVLFNRAIGIPAGADAIRRALRHFESRGVTRFFLHLGPAAGEPAVQSLLRRYGLERYRRAWHKLLRDAARPLAPIATELSIRRASAADADSCGLILSRAFETGEASRGIFAAAVHHPAWRVFVASPPEDPGGAPISVGGLFIDDEIGYLGFGATVPEHRGRRGQAALMAHRVRHAASLGCRWLTTETGEPVPGEPSPSHRNMLRCGFAVAQRRDNYAPIGFTWDPPQAS